MNFSRESWGSLGTEKDQNKDLNEQPTHRDKEQRGASWHTGFALCAFEKLAGRLSGTRVVCRDGQLVDL